MKPMIETVVIVKTHVIRFKVELSSSSVQFEARARARSTPMMSRKIAAQMLDERNKSK